MLLDWGYVRLLFHRNLVQQHPIIVLGGLIDQELIQVDLKEFVFLSAYNVHVIPNKASPPTSFLSN